MPGESRKASHQQKGVEQEDEVDSCKGSWGVCTAYDGAKLFEHGKEPKQKEVKNEREDREMMETKKAKGTREIMKRKKKKKKAKRKEGLLDEIHRSLSSPSLAVVLSSLLLTCSDTHRLLQQEHPSCVSCFL